MLPLFVAIVAWIIIGFIDAAVKGRIAARYAPSTDVPWEQCPEFWKDTGSIIKWRNCLAAMAVCAIGVVVYLKEWLFICHFVSLFICEYPLYWAWVFVLQIPQKEVFDPWESVRGPEYGNWRTSTYLAPPALDWVPTLPRRPARLGELPYRPMWLPSIYRALRLNRWATVGVIVLANAIGAAIWGAR